jgi:hypothetical protein
MRHLVQPAAPALKAHISAWLCSAPARERDMDRSRKALLDALL